MSRRYCALLTEALGLKREPAIRSAPRAVKTFRVDLACNVELRTSVEVAAVDADEAEARAYDLAPSTDEWDLTYAERYDTRVIGVTEI